MTAAGIKYHFAFYQALLGYITKKGSHNVSPPFKRGEAKIWKFQKGGNLKKFWDLGNQKGGKIFKNKGGNPTF